MINTQLNMADDVKGRTAYAPDFSNTNFSTTLASGVEQSFTVPENHDYWIALFSTNPGANVFVAVNDTASVFGSSFANTNSTLNPAVRRVQAGDELSFITPDTAAYIGVSLYVV